MEKAVIIKQYYKILIESLDVAESIFAILDRARQASMKLDYSTLDQENQSLLKASSQLEQYHLKRQQLAAKLGCTSDRFTTEVLDKVSGNVKKTLTDASMKLQTLLTDCQVKIESQTDLLLEQQNVLHEASQTLRVEVNA